LTPRGTERMRSRTCWLTRGRASRRKQTGARAAREPRRESTLQHFRFAPRPAAWSPPPRPWATSAAIRRPRRCALCWRHSARLIHLTADCDNVLTPLNPKNTTECPPLPPVTPFPPASPLEYTHALTHALAHTLTRFTTPPRPLALQVRRHARHRGAQG